MRGTCEQGGELGAEGSFSNFRPKTRGGEFKGDSALDEMRGDVGESHMVKRSRAGETEERNGARWSRGRCLGSERWRNANFTSYLRSTLLHTGPGVKAPLPLSFQIVCCPMDGRYRYIPRRPSNQRQCTVTKTHWPSGEVMQEGHRGTVVLGAQTLLNTTTPTRRAHRKRSLDLCGSRAHELSRKLEQEKVRKEAPYLLCSVRGSDGKGRGYGRIEKT